MDPELRPLYVLAVELRVEAIAEWMRDSISGSFLDPSIRKALRFHWHLFTQKRVLRGLRELLSQSRPNCKSTQLVIWHTSLVIVCESRVALRD